MTHKELMDVPLMETFNDIYNQLLLDEREDTLFVQRYRFHKTLQEIADGMCLDIQTVKRIHKRIKHKLAYVDTSKIRHWNDF